MSPVEAVDTKRRDPRCRLSPQPDHDEIARCAYELYLLRGAEDGRDLHDWLEAERRLAKTPQRGAKKQGTVKKPAASSPGRRSIKS